MLSTRDGTLDIPPFGYAKIRDVDRENLTVIYAMDRNWAEIVDKEPKPKVVLKDEVKTEITESYKGMTFEELQLEQAEKAKAKEPEAEPEPEPASPKPKKVK